MFMKIHLIPKIIYGILKKSSVDFDQILLVFIDTFSLMSIAKTSNFRHIYFSDLSLLNIDFICPLWYVCARENLRDYVPHYLCSLVLFNILNMHVS